MINIYLRKQIIQAWWFMSLILATQKADIRKITIQSQPWTNSSRDYILKTLITKRAGRDGSNGKSVCVARVRP
jgi:hypothetical protein